MTFTLTLDMTLDEFIRRCLAWSPQQAPAGPTSTATRREWEAALGACGSARGMRLSGCWWYRLPQGFSGRAARDRCARTHAQRPAGAPSAGLTHAVACRAFRAAARLCLLCAVHARSCGRARVLECRRCCKSCGPTAPLRSASPWSSRTQRSRPHACRSPPRQRLPHSGGSGRRSL